MARKTSLDPVLFLLIVIAYVVLFVLGLDAYLDRRFGDGVLGAVLMSSAGVCAGWVLWLGYRFVRRKRS